MYRPIVFGRVVQVLLITISLLPGLYEFVQKGDPPVMGITKLGNGITEEFLRRPRKVLEPPSVDVSADRMRDTTPGP